KRQRGTVPRWRFGLVSDLPAASIPPRLNGRAFGGRGLVPFVPPTSVRARIVPLQPGAGTAPPGRGPSGPERPARSRGKAMKLPSVLRSLAHRNYRLFFAGQGISLIGTWMQQIAMSWLVFQMRRSNFQLGLVLFCGQIPALFLAPVAGVLTDRWNRHRL